MQNLRLKNPRSAFCEKNSKAKLKFLAPRNLLCRKFGVSAVLKLQLRAQPTSLNPQRRQRRCVRATCPSRSHHRCRRRVAADCRSWQQSMVTSCPLHRAPTAAAAANTATYNSLDFRELSIEHDHIGIF